MSVGDGTEAESDGRNEGEQKSILFRYREGQEKHFQY